VLKVEDSAAELAGYQDAYANLLEIALDPAESLAFIEQAASEKSLS